MSRTRWTLPFDLHNMVKAPAGDATPQRIYRSIDGVMQAYGTTVPTDGTSGYAKGCVFHHVDGGARDRLYVNDGTGTSCNFNPILSGAPSRAATSGREYGVEVDGDTFLDGGDAGAQSYLFYVHGDKTLGTDTGDAYSGLIFANGSNYAANGTDWTFRAVNCSINNRSGGTAGQLDANFGTQNKSGGTVARLRGVTTTVENYGTVSDEFIGIDVILKNEGAVATAEAGIRVRNLNNSIADAVGAGILFSDTGANTGWDYVVDMNGASVVVADLRLSAGICILSGAGAPSAAAPKGSLYLRTDGTTTNDRAYINTDGSTTWTALTTAA